MRAVIRRDGALVVDEMAAPEPQAGQVLVKSLVCGICGSDLHALDHYDHMIDLTAKVGGFSQMTKGADTVFGHEFCCEVLENGPQTAGRFRPGARVVSIPGLLRADGADPIGYSSRVPGGFAETMVLTEALMLEVPNGLAPEQAALTEPLAVGEHAVAKAQGEADHVFLVVGSGPVGLAVIASLKARGVGPVLASDYSPERRAAAELMGADGVVDPARVSPRGRRWACRGPAPRPSSPPPREGASSGRSSSSASGPPASCRPWRSALRWAAGSSSPAYAWRPTPSNRW
jgi:threonine dehydrogenase-like Zn-dependent dehydrogenase